MRGLAWWWSWGVWASVRCCVVLHVQVEFNPGLQSSRYKHFLLPWDNQLLAVGGQVCW